MATSADTVFETRTTGSNLNGAGYSASVGGAGSVDYSTSDAAVLTHTDATTSNVSTALTIPATGTQFDATMVGNMVAIVIAAVFSCRRQIVAYVSPTQVTLDSNPPTSSAGAATIRVGGAYKIDQNAIVQESLGTPVAGNVVWVRAGTYTITANSVHVGSVGTVTQPVIVKGYNTTRGDLDSGNQALAKPLLVYSAGTLNMLQLRQTQVFRNLEIDSSTNTGQIAVLFDASTAHSTVQNCKITGAIGVACVDMSGTSNIFRGNYVIAATGNSDGVLCRGNGNHLVELNHIRSAGSPNNFTGVLSDVGTNTIRGNIIQDFTFGVYALAATLSGSIVENNIIHRCTNGIESNHANQGIVGLMSVRWNIISRSTRGIYYGIGDISANTGAIGYALAAFDCNYFYGNTNNYVNLPPGSGDVILTADPFTDEATYDFSLNSVAGGGAVVRAQPCTVSFADAINSATMYGGIVGSPVVATDAATTFMRSLWRQYNGEFSSTITDAMVDIYLDAGLEWLNRLIRYYQTTSTSDITLVAGTQEYSIPTSWTEILWLQINGQEIQKGDIEQWRSDSEAWRAEPNGFPRFFAAYANKLVFRPAPDAATVALAANPVIRVVTKPDSITTSGPLQLQSQDYRIVVFLATAEWAHCFPDSAVAQLRGDYYQKRAEDAAQGIAEQYARRGISR